MVTCIETYSGKYFDFRRPRAEDVDISDVAVALSNTVRFGGHVSRFYSVAEHATLTSRLVRERTHSPMLAYAALHHDDHEAYLGDVPSPLKAQLGRKYRRLARRVDHAIAEAFGIDLSFLHHAEIKAADARALAIEAAVLKDSKGVGEHWGRDTVASVPEWAVWGEHPQHAESWFMQCHWSLRHELGL